MKILLKPSVQAGNGIKCMLNQRVLQGEIIVGKMKLFALKLQQVIFKKNMRLSKSRFIMI